MSEDKIEEIRARHERDNRYGDGLYPGAHRDRSTLLAEVERQRADNELLREENERLTRERNEARAEVARMKKLHAPLTDLPWPAREEVKP